MPKRCRTRMSAAAPARTRTALCDRTVTPPMRTSMPTRYTSIASAMHRRDGPVEDDGGRTEAGSRISLVRRIP